MSFPDVSSQINNSLHALHLSLDVCIKVLRLYFGESQEVYGARITGCGILGNEQSQRLIDVLRQERRIRRLGRCQQVT